MCSGPQPPASDPAGVQVLGQRRFEVDAAVVRVAVDGVGGPLDSGADAGQRPEDGLVAGQFDRARDRLAGNVRRQLGHFGAEASGHFDSICLACVRYPPRRSRRVRARPRRHLSGVRYPQTVQGGVPERPNGTHC